MINQLSSVLGKGRFKIAAFTILGLFLAIVATFAQPLQYGSTARLLILQGGSGLEDAYNALRSEELVADKLATVLYTTSFFNEVVAVGYGISRSDFSADDRSARKQWKKKVSASVSRGSGILNVTTYDTDPAKAEAFLRAITEVMINRVDNYTSSGNIEVKLIDNPLNSRFPIKPNVLTNILTGILMGFLTGFGLVLWNWQAKKHQK